LDGHDGVYVQADNRCNLPWLCRRAPQRAVVHVNVEGHPVAPAIDQAFHVGRRMSSHYLVDRCTLFVQCDGFGPNSGQAAPATPRGPSSLVARSTVRLASAVPCPRQACNVRRLTRTLEAGGRLRRLVCLFLEVSGNRPTCGGVVEGADHQPKSQRGLLRQRVRASYGNIE
jgi:hypothetical protein